MYADTIFKNGQVITVDSQDNIAEAIAVRNGKILAVGDNDEVDLYANQQTEVIDLKGRSLLPGFIDAHAHLIVHALGKIVVDCRAPHIQSIPDLIIELKKKAATTPPGQWVSAVNLYEHDLVEKRLPTRWELDEASEDHPVFVMRMDIHNSILNSKGLEVAKINQDTLNPKGGSIEQDASGVPTGLLRETAHYKVFDMMRPADEEIMKGISLTQDELSAAGITSLHEAGGFGPSDFRLMQKASRKGVIKTRIFAFILSLNNPKPVIENAIKAGVLTGTGDENFRFGPAKVFLDGSSAVPDIAVRESYSHQNDEYGSLFYTKEELEEIFIEAHGHGLQLTVHANGDKAIETMLDCIESALEKYPRENPRHRIEHASLAQPDLLKRMKELGVVPVPNPGFIYNMGDNYLKFFGDRVMHPIADLLEAGLHVAAGSDSPVYKEYSPLFGIWGAITRLTKNGNVYGEGKRISVKEAIRLYTINGAYASFEEDIKGSIETGKLADMVVLNDRILDVDVKEIKDLEVDLTMINGNIVFEK